MAGSKSNRRSRMVLSFALSLLMAFGCVPTFAIAEAVEQSSSEDGTPVGESEEMVVAESSEGLPNSDGESEQVETSVELVLVENTLGSGESSDNDELVASYIEEQFNEQIPRLSRRRSNSAVASANLTLAELNVYTTLKQDIALVAEGELATTEFSIPVGDVYDVLSYTPAELGVSASDRDAVVAAARERFTIDFPKVLDCLLADCPYELYWYDKTTSYTFSRYPSMTTSYSGGLVAKITAQGSLSFRMPVAQNYAAGAYEVQTPIGQSIQTAVENAGNIVQANKGTAVRARLEAYKEAICDEVSYNFAAAQNTNTPYGDPWQLVYVFDGNDSTNVVCEGYSKAFKYLCDLTWPDQDLVECRLVDGQMVGGTGAGGHMWNVVRMDDGKNYLVDVTNCDDGTIGAPSDLFLAFGPRGEWNGTYTFSAGQSGVGYAYSADTISLYGESGLVISDDAYVAPAPKIEVEVPSATDGLVYDGTVQTGVAGSEGYALTNGSNTNAGDYTATATLEDGYVWSDGTSGSKEIPWSISRRLVTVTADDVTKEQDEDDPELTVTIDGLVNGDTLLYELTREQGEDLGEYAITPTGNAVQGNYDVTYVSGVLTITPATIDYGAWGECTWVLYQDGQLVIRPSDGVSGQITSSLPAGLGSIRLMVASVSFQPGVKANASMSGMFSGFSNMEVADLSELDTSVTTDMSQLFSGCRKLTSVDLAGLDTSGVSNMSSMFDDCRTLPELDLSSFDTSNATSMSDMFLSCKKLQSIVLGTDFSFCGSGDVRLCELPSLYEDDQHEAVWYSPSADVQYACNELPNNTAGTYIRATPIDYSTKVKVQFESAAFTYDGSEKRLSVRSITHDSYALQEGIDYEVCYEGDLVNANSSAKVTVVGKGRYTSSRSKTYSIAAASIRDATVQIEATQYVYDGTAKEPAVLLVTHGGKTLLPQTDYTVSYESNTAAGNGRVRVNGSGNYKEYVDTSFVITPSLVDVPVAKTGLVYTGSTQTGVENNSLYTLYGAAADNAGSYQATAMLNDTANYRWSDGTTSNKYVDWSIAQRVLGNDDVVFSAVEDKVYSGTSFVPSPTITCGTTTLVKGTDYTLAYASNTMPGTAFITATFKGNYSGMATTTFTIKPFPADGLSIDDIGYRTYTGSQITPVPMVRFGTKVLTLGQDYTCAYEDNVNAGTASVVITGMGPYDGTARKTFTINPASFVMANTNLQQMELSSVYDGSSKVPSLPTIDYYFGNGATATLTKDMDYTVETEGDTTNAGQFTTTITATGNIAGSIVCTNTIAPAELQDANVTLEQSELTYTGEALTPGVLVTFANKTLVKDDDYTVSYSSNVNTSNGATVTVEGTGNYKGTVIKSFTVLPRSLSGAQVVLSPSEYEFRSVPSHPYVRVILDGKELVAGTDYEQSDNSYSDLAAGSHSFTVVGKGNYTGEASATLTVRPANLSGATVTFDPQYYQFGGVYDGFPKTPGTIVRLGANTLTPGEDYTVEYSNNVHAGQDVGVATVIGTGNYAGQATGSFSIVSRNISATNSFEVVPSSVTYNGEEQKPGVVLKDVCGDGQKTLVEGTDYTLSYEDNVLPGSATVIATGKGDYQGTISRFFTINPASFSEVTVDPVPEYSIDSLNQKFEIRPSLSVRYNGALLQEGTDYTAQYPTTELPGTYTIMLWGQGLFDSSVVLVDVTVVGPISDAYVLPIPQQGYTGEQLKPKPDVYLDDSKATKLTEGVDYTLSYANNIDLGYGTVTITGKGYYYGSNTQNFKIAPYPLGWFKRGDSWYYADYTDDDTGDVMYLYKGLGYINNRYYYFDEATGALQSGWQRVNGNWYYLNPADGCRAATGWAKVGSAWYYFDESGAMKTGWLKLGSTWYYLKSSGAMAVGWAKVGSSWYYFDGSGAMKTGWQKIGATWYYFSSSGAMVTGRQNIGGTWYTFSSSGAWVR